MPKISIIPINQTFLDYSSTVMMELLQVGLDAEINTNYEDSLNSKVKTASDAHDLIVIIGAEEIKENKVTIRKNEASTMVSIEQLIQMLLDENIGE